MLFVGLRQDSSLLHYWSRRKLHLVTAMGITPEWSLLFSANPDLATCLTPGAVAINSPFGIITMDVSVLAVSVATTVYCTVTVFRFFQFAYPYDWYPDYDYGYPHDNSYYDYSPVFGNRYSSNLAMLVQSELARPGYYADRLMA